MKEADYYHFEVDDKYFLFHRDSFSIAQLPHTPPLSQKDEILLQDLMKSEESKSRNVGPLTLRTIALNITNNCNFGCDYCFAHQGSFDKPGLIMDKSVAFEAIDYLFENTVLNRKRKTGIAFFGGEPLLEWNLIKDIVTYSKKNKPKGIDPRYLITTNASLLDEEKLNFFKENKFSVMVSIDGTKEKHDNHRKLKNGKGTYDLVVNNIKRANKQLPLTFRATISNDNLDLIEITNHFRDLGAKMITFGVDNDHLDVENYSKLAQSYRQLGDFYFRDIIANRFYEITNFTEVMLQIVFKERKTSHCNAGLSYMGISADGSFYKCPRFTGEEEHRFGNIKDVSGMIQKRDLFANQLRENVTERNINCLECVFALMCGGLCHYDLSQKNKGDADIIQEQCLLRKTVYDQVLRLYVKIPEDIKRKFLIYISQ